MNIELFAIKDRALDAFMRPWAAQSVNQAIRMFQDEVNNPQGEIYKHPDDYDLYHIGAFAEQHGNLIPLADGPTQIAIGKHLKHQATL